MDPSSSFVGRLETGNSSKQAGVVPAIDDGETFVHIGKAAAASVALRGAREGSMGNCAQRLHVTRTEAPETLEGDWRKLKAGAVMGEAVGCAGGATKPGAWDRAVAWVASKGASASCIVEFAWSGRGCTTDGGQ